MTQVTVKELAQVVNTPVERLLQQMSEAGLPHKSAEQAVTDSEKQALLAHLRRPVPYFGQTLGNQTGRKKGLRDRIV